MTASVDASLDHLLATALVGTARQSWPPVDEAMIPAAGSAGGDPAEPSPDGVHRVVGEGTGGPEAAVLDAASRRRVLRLLAEPPLDPLGPAGVPLGDEVGACPAAVRPQAPPTAAEALAAALAHRDAWSVEIWMEAAARHAVTVPPVLWTPLAQILVTVPRVPRRVLGDALGPQGRWFFSHHPEWRALVTPWPPVADLHRAQQPSGAADSRAALQIVLTGPGPWPAAVVDAALAEALSGRFRGSDGRRLGILLGRRLPLPAYGRFVAAAQALTARSPDPGGPAPALEVWGVIEEVLTRRREIEECFDPPAAEERAGPSRGVAGVSSADEEAR